MMVSDTKLADKIALLAKTACSGTIDLRYSHGSWCVMVGIGNTMRCVPGTVCSSPEEAVVRACARWDKRSAAEPFVP